MIQPLAEGECDRKDISARSYQSASFESYQALRKENTRLKGLAFKRLLPTLAGLALLLGVGPPKAQAQDNTDPTFSSFTMAAFETGYTFTINGNAVNSGNPVGTNGDYVFGFSSTNTPIVINFGSAGNDPFGGNGVETITGIDGVYLASNGSNDGQDAVTATVGTAPIKDYNGNANPPPWVGGTAPGANFPDYQAGNFGSANYLREGSGTNPATGDYSFTNIAQSSTATGPILFGLHLRNDQGLTKFILFDPAPVPEPAYVQLGGLLFLGGLGTAFRTLRKRRTT